MVAALHLLIFQQILLLLVLFFCFLQGVLLLLRFLGLEMQLTEFLLKIGLNFCSSEFFR